MATSLEMTDARGLSDRLLVPGAEPATDTQAITLRRQHRMLAPRRKKTHQSAGNRFDIPMAVGRAENPQLAARRGRPTLVQVQHQRHLALRAASRLVDV